MRQSRYLLIFIFLLQACGKKNTAPPPPELPTAVKLVFPFENYLCNVGTNITPSESTVMFEWESGENADSYELILKNATTGTVSTHPTTDKTLPIVLQRNTPYTWYVVSRSNSVSDTAHSVTWKFWNAGPAATSYAPFPAEIVSPGMAEKISATANVITLDWNGNDVDNDISGFDVYFGTNTTPALFKSDLKESVLDNVSVSPNTIYYWKVVTKDSKGNTSDSGVYQFKVL